MKRQILRVLLVSLVTLTLAVGCGGGNDIKGEAAECLAGITEEGVDGITREIDGIEAELDIVVEKLQKFNQVMAPALEWIEGERAKAASEYGPGSWQTEVTHEGLDKLGNDRYGVTQLELLAYDVGTPEQKFVTVIKVTDLTTKKEYDSEELGGELEEQKSSLLRRWEVRAEDGQRAVSVLESVLEHTGDWETDKIDSTSYRVSGPGLGMAEELTGGEWVYHRDSREIVPSNSRSVALKRALCGEF